MFISESKDILNNIKSIKIIKSYYKNIYIMKKLDNNFLLKHRIRKYLKILNNYVYTYFNEYNGYNKKFEDCDNFKKILNENYNLIEDNKYYYYERK